MGNFWGRPATDTKKTSSAQKKTKQNLHKTWFYNALSFPYYFSNWCVFVWQKRNFGFRTDKKTFREFLMDSSFFWVMMIMIVCDVKGRSEDDRFVCIRTIAISVSMKWSIVSMLSFVKSHMERQGWLVLWVPVHYAPTFLLVSRRFPKWVCLFWFFFLGIAHRTCSVHR